MKKIVTLVITLFMLLSSTSIKGLDNNEFILDENNQEDNLDYIYGREMSEEEIQEQINMEADLARLANFDATLTDDYRSVERNVIPSAYNANNLGLVTSVKNQNPYGLCWAVSTISIVETAMIKGGYANNSIDLSERALGFFSYNTVEDPLGLTRNDYNIGYGGAGNWANGGATSIFATHTLLKGIGPISEALAPYNGNVVDANLAYNHNVTSIKDVVYISSTNTQRIKESILKYGAGSLEYFHTTNGMNYNTGAYFVGNNVSNYYNNHEVSIVGWDDNYSRFNFKGNNRPSSNGAFIIKNSFGANYGANGYNYISYEDACFTGISNYPVVFLDVESPNTYDYNYQYDGTGISNHLTVANNSALTNQFIVQGSENQVLNAVSFQTFTGYTSYEIQIYKNPTDINKPNTGIPMLKEVEKGFVQDAGYYKINLKEEVMLQKDDVFAVEIKVSGASETVNFGIDKSVPKGEGMWDGFSSVNTTAKNQSFLMSNTGEYSDLAKDTISARIKAYTKTIEVPKLMFTESSVELNIAEKYQLLFKNDVSDGVSFISSNEKVAEVDEFGVISAVSKGFAQITAHKDNYIDAHFYVYIPDEEFCKPDITNVQFTGMSAEGYTIEADVENADNISKIIFPTWSAVNGQDDVVYGNGVIKGNKVTFQVKTKDHQYDTGDYLTRIYIYDKKGKEYYGGEHKAVVKGNAPSISNVQFTGMSAEGYTIEADVENADNISKIIFPTWSAVNGQDDVVYGNGVIKGNKVTFQVKTKDHQYDTGDYLTRIYIYDKKGKEYYGGEHKAVVKGNAPSISNVQFTGMSAEGYTIEADVENADNISKIIFPTWSAVNGQDDVVYGNGVIKGNKVTFQVKTKDHQYDAGDYLTRIYIYDKKGKEYYGGEYKAVVKGNTPSISNVQFTGMSAEGYTIEADVENADNISKIIFPTWSAVNGQDDVVYGNGVIKGSKVTFQVKTKDHQYDAGDYLTRIYIYDKKGKEYYGDEHKVNVAIYPPSISNVQFTGMSAEGYTIEADVENADNISKIIFPTWSAVNGQDDVVYGDGVIKGNRVTFQVKTKDHQYDTGDYLTRIYIYDKKGKEYYGGEHKVNVAIYPPSISNVQFTDMGAEGYTIEADVENADNISKIIFPTWSAVNGQDDVVYGDGIIRGNKVTFQVKTKDHHYDTGDYLTRIYIYDKKGKEYYGGEYSFMFN